jgi:uncharacterized membrane protein YqjE
MLQIKSLFRPTLKEFKNMNELVEHTKAPGLITSIKELYAGLLSSAKNRFELFLVELREERTRVLELLLWAAGALFLSLMSFIIITTAVLLLFSQDARVYAAAAFSIGYFVLAGYSIVRLKKLLKQFTQFNRECLKSLK